MKVYVECYSSYKYAETPKIIIDHGKKHIINNVVKRWRTPGGVYFIVSIKDSIIKLFYDEQKDQWFMLEENII